MAAQDCLDAIRQAAGDLSDDEILEITEIVQRQRNRLAAEGNLDNLDQRLREAARGEGDKAKIAAALARKHAALNAIVGVRLDAHFEKLMASGRFTPAEAAVAMLHGSTKGVELARWSVAWMRQSYDKRFWYEMFARIQRDRPHLVAADQAAKGELTPAAFAALDDAFDELAIRCRNSLKPLGGTNEQPAG